MIQENHKIHLYAPCKINLFLHIIEKRKDGYHDLESLIGFLDLKDTIEISQSLEFSIEYSGRYGKNLEKTIGSQDHLALNIIRDFAKLHNKGEAFKINIEKNIPYGAGLGGGSSDAAALLLFINKFLNINANLRELIRFSQKYGADIPVCLQKKCSFVSGIGEEIQTLNSQLNYEVIIVYPKIPISTAAIFSQLKPENYFKKSLKSKANKLFKKNNIVEFKACTENDLEAVACALYPKVLYLLSFMKMLDGNELSRMSGSGSACFSLFKNTEKANNAALEIQKKFPQYDVFKTKFYQLEK